MKISKEYGPQFYEADGTVGKTQLVKRWAVVKVDGFMFAAQQGRNTRATKQEAEQDLVNIQPNSPVGLTVGAFWCWPNHFDPVGTATDYEALAKQIMENYPEYSLSVQCVSWNYQEGIFKFIDEEDGKEHTVTTQQVAEALPKLRAMLGNNQDGPKLFLAGLHSDEESFSDAGNWDAEATDALVQIVIFGEVIYG